jgi:quercetin dioxygenase-like cupin family protein
MTASPEPGTADRSAAQATVQVDNDRVRVTEWRFAPGAATGWHRHAYDYVVVPMTTGTLRIQNRETETAADLVSGRAYFRSLGVEHDVTNVNAYEFVFIEVEVKR